jgi:hypothetical protein
MASNVSQGFPVLVSQAGPNSVDPRDYSGDAAALNDLLSTMTDEGDGGILYLPGRRPDGNSWNLEDTVDMAPQSSPRVAVSLQGVGFAAGGSSAITTTITDGSPMFRWDAEDKNVNTVWVDSINTFPGGNNAETFHFIEQDYTVDHVNVFNWTGPCIRNTGPMFNFAIRDVTLNGATTSGSVGVLCESNANGAPGDWVLSEEVLINKTADAGVRITDANGVAEIAGQVESQGTPVDSQVGQLQITDTARIKQSGGGAAAVEHSGGRFECTGGHIFGDGDGIDLSGLFGYYRIGEAVDITVSGTPINAPTPGNTSTPSVLPDRDTVDGTVSYPTGTSSVYEMDATQL